MRTIAGQCHKYQEKDSRPNACRGATPSARADPGLAGCSSDEQRGGTECGEQRRNSRKGGGWCDGDHGGDERRDPGNGHPRSPPLA